MTRRTFITLLGGAAVAWPLAARAQQGERMRLIGVLMSYDEGNRIAQALVAAFREALAKLGWAEGLNIRFDYRWAATRTLVDQSAKELVALHPDLIFSSGSPSTASLLQQTRTIPIVLANLVDPVGQGFVAGPRPRHGPGGPAGSAKAVESLRTGLREFGYVEGTNIGIEFRWAEGIYDRLPHLVAELIATNVKLGW